MKFYGRASIFFVLFGLILIFLGYTVTSFTSSFTSNGLAIATITPFLLSINASIYSKEVIIAIAGFIVGLKFIKMRVLALAEYI